MIAGKFAAVAAAASVANAMSASENYGEAYFKCEKPASCAIPLEDGGDNCDTNAACCAYDPSPPAWIENDPRDSCNVMKLLCERGINYETSSFARCHAYLSGESTYTPSTEPMPTDCDYKCDETGAAEATRRRRRQDDDNSENTAVPVSLADCQWEFDSLQLERGSPNRGTKVTVAVVKGGIDIAHEVMPSWDRVKRVCNTTTDDVINRVEPDRGDGSWSVPEMKIDCAADNSVEELSRVAYPMTMDDKTIGTVGSLFGPRTETGLEGYIPDADMFYYSFLNSYYFSYNDWTYNAVVDAVDNGADILLLGLETATSCIEEVTYVAFEPTAVPPLPYWSNFTAEQNATWPLDRLLVDLAEYDSKPQTEQEELLSALPAAMVEYNVEWEKENEVYQAAKLVYAQGALEYARRHYDALFQYAYDNDVFVISSVGTPVELKEAQGLTQCQNRLMPSIDRSLRPYMVGTLDATQRIVERTYNGTDSGGVDAVAPGGDLWFGGSAPPNLQPIMGIPTATTCQYRVMWTETESKVQDKPNYYQFNSGAVHSVTIGAAVAARAVQAIKERGEKPTVLKIDEEMKKYMIQPTWCEGTECDAYGGGILTMKVQV